MTAHPKPSISPTALWWIAATCVSALGSGIMRVAISWTATGHGGRFAGLVSLATALPTVLLVLWGGALGDRKGQRHVLLRTTFVSVFQYVGFYALWRLGLDLRIVLLANALTSGVNAGFSGPSSTVYARRLTSPESVARTVAVAASASMVMSLVSPAVGGFVVAHLSIGAALLVNIVSFGAVIWALFSLRPTEEPPPKPSGTPMWRTIADGAVALVRHRELRTLIISLLFVAAALLTVSGLGLPLLVRQRGWHADRLGLLEACVTGGSLAMATLISTRGQWRRAGAGMMTGVVTACGALTGLALTTSLPAACVLCVALGAGTVVYTMHLSPVYIALTPSELLSRFSSMMFLAQALPTMLASPLIGWAAESWEAPRALLLCAGIGVLAVVPLGASRRARELRLPERTVAQPEAAGDGVTS